MIKKRVKPYHKIKAIIVSKGLKQKEVAEAIGMNRTLLNIKLNRIDGRDFTTCEAKKLAEFLKVKIDDFF